MIATKMHSIEFSSLELLREVKCPGNLRENSGNLAFQKCGHPDELLGQESVTILKLLLITCTTKCMHMKKPQFITDYIARLPVKCCRASSEYTL